MKRHLVRIHLPVPLLLLLVLAPAHHDDDVDDDVAHGDDEDNCLLENSLAIFSPLYIIDGILIP